jgi:hypothetical protein
VARIRSIKPEFWQDEKLARLPRDTRLLFIGLWNLADDEGRLRGNPLFIRASVFPYDLDVDVQGGLKELERIGRIRSYTEGDETFIWVCKFAEHQKIDTRIKSKLPAPPIPADKTALNTEKSAEPAEKSAFNAEKLPRKGKEQGEEQGTGSRDAPPTSADETGGAGFFAWVQQKRHAAGLARDRLVKPEAIASWYSAASMELNGDEDRLRAGYERFTTDGYWGRQKPPWPFNAFMKQWEDFIPPAAPKPAKCEACGRDTQETAYGHSVCDSCLINDFGPQQATREEFETWLEERSGAAA